jgi:hypothetical protein
MKVALIACYELGHQPLHVASVAARLRARDHEVRCVDLALDPWEPGIAAWADRMALSVPMHTAMRIAQGAIALARDEHPDLPIAAFGLYAHVMASSVSRALAGESDDAVVRWVEGEDPGAMVQRARADQHRVPVPRPARDLLPPLERYVRLRLGAEERLVAYTEASRGCVHRCRHCPVPVVYDGRIRIFDVDTVLADVDQQVAAGARHLSFGDPDFLNGPKHAGRVVTALHERFPELTFDCTVKVEHVLRHRELWADFAAAGCLFVVSAFESVDATTLQHLAKGHSVQDMAEAVALLRAHGIEIRPSWMPFTPWTTSEQIREMLEFVRRHDLVASIDPVQYTIRLLLPPGSLLLADPDVVAVLDRYDEARGSYRWRHPDPAIDQLQVELASLVERDVAAGAEPGVTYEAIRAACGLAPSDLDHATSSTRPRLTETWFCCAEPTETQLALEPTVLSRGPT